jgi:hypothetical protein
MQMHKRWLSKTRWLSILLVFLLSLGLTGCGDRPNFPSFSSSRPSARSQAIKIKEVAPPDLIRDLRGDLNVYQPQVQILSPRSDEILQTQTVTVRFSVQDLPLFKDETLGLGPHLHVFVDDQPYQAVYDSTTPLVLEDLTPGTHTIRAFASRPWHESFKNEGSFAQTTFHVYAKTTEKAPNPEAPLLTYSRPQGTYGAEPIMLDFFLTQAPLHAIAQADEEDGILDWSIRCTVNGESFEIDEWRPIYLKGLKPGQNWVQLELIDETGTAIANVFNDTVRIIDYTPNGQDALSQLVRNELPIDEARRIVIAGYEPPAPEPEVIPVVEPATEDLLEPTEEPTPALEIAPDLAPGLQEPTIPEDGVEVPAPEDLPIEILAPDVETGTESALEQRMDEIQEQVAPVDGDAAAVDQTFEGQAAAQVAQAMVGEPPAAMDEESPAPMASPLAPPPANRPLEPLVLEPLAIAPNPPTESVPPESIPEAPISSDAADEFLAAAPSVESEAANPQETVDQQDSIQTPALSERGASRGIEQPKAAIAPSRTTSQIKVATPTVKPSPVLNSYEAKAILEELNELETRMEDLKGTIASATDQPSPPDLPSPQIEDLRSQLDQLKDKFGDTWQRLSNFVQLKLQG